MKYYISCNHKLYDVPDFLEFIKHNDTVLYQGEKTSNGNEIYLKSDYQEFIDNPIGLHKLILVHHFDGDVDPYIKEAGEHVETLNKDERERLFYMLDEELKIILVEKYPWITTYKPYDNVDECITKEVKENPYKYYSGLKATLKATKKARKDDNMIYKYCKHDNANGVIQLIKDDNNLDINNLLSLLRIAVINNSVNVVKEIIKEKKHSISESFIRTLFKYSCHYKSNEVTEYLLDFVDDQYDEEILKLLAYNDDENLYCKTFNKYIDDVDLYDKDIIKGIDNINIIKYLVNDIGLEINSENALGVVMKGNLEILKYIYNELGVEISNNVNKLYKIHDDKYIFEFFTDKNIVDDDTMYYAVKYIKRNYGLVHNIIDVNGNSTDDFFNVMFRKKKYNHLYEFIEFIDKNSNKYQELSRSYINYFLMKSISEGDLENTNYHNQNDLQEKDKGKSALDEIHRDIIFYCGHLDIINYYVKEKGCGITKDDIYTYLSNKNNEIRAYKYLINNIDQSVDEPFVSYHNVDILQYVIDPDEISNYKKLLRDTIVNKGSLECIRYIVRELDFEVTYKFIEKYGKYCKEDVYFYLLDVCVDDIDYNKEIIMLYKLLNVNRLKFIERIIDEERISRDDIDVDSLIEADVRMFYSYEDKLKLLRNIIEHRCY